MARGHPNGPRTSSVRTPRSHRYAIGCGLHVILTEFHKSARIDRQLFGRSARQGNPGSVEAIVPMEDELFVRVVGPRLRACARMLVGGSRGACASWLVGRPLRFIAQRNAERSYGRIRRQTVEQDKRLDKYLAFAEKSE